MALTAEHLGLEVDGVKHLDDVTFTLERGRLHALIGRTLAGKTTLLRAIAGLQRLDDGTIDLDGRPFHILPVWERDVAMVYEEFINYPHLTVFDNVAFPLRRRGLGRDAARERARTALEQVSLTGFDDRRPVQLSGGQQQRVAIARALVRDAEVLLLDEPLVNLDYKLREQMREEFTSLFSDRGGSVVLYTTTDPAEAMILGDIVFVMHEGRLIQVGPPDEVFDQPATTAVAGIVNDPPMNIFDGVIEDGNVRIGGSLSLPLAAHARGLSPGPHRFGLRAMEVDLGSEDDLKGTVTFSEVSGSETFVHVDTGAGPLVLHIDGVHSFELNAALPAVIDPQFKVLLRRKLREITAQFRQTVIYVTHDQNEAMTFANEVVVMNHGQVVQRGSPEQLFEYPQTSYVGYFIGSPSMNFLPAEADSGSLVFAGSKLRSAYDAAKLPSGKLEIGVRAEYLQFMSEPGENTLTAQVTGILNQGSVRVVTLLVAGAPVKVTITRGEPIPSGDVLVRLPADKIRAYVDGELVAGVS